MEQPNCSRKVLVTDHHGWSPCVLKLAFKFHKAGILLVWCSQMLAVKCMVAFLASEDILAVDASGAYVHASRESLRYGPVEACT